MASTVSAKTRPGIDVLRETNYKILEGKKVGLLTHPAGVDSTGTSTVEILNSSKAVDLVALFGPEHGIYGDEKANQPVDNKIDPKTKLPVYSLYGKYRTPTDEMLKGIDVLVIDLQDIGVRSYTYISCMRLAIEACFKNKVEVVILDRPNPLGGVKVGGPIMNASLRSYVGTFMIPYVHGLTIGELATIAKNTEKWLDVDPKIRKKGKLTVIPMQNWKREMTWNQTKLKWIPTSPGIPSIAAVLGYAMVGLGAEINGFRHGFGTQYPFRLLTHKDLDANSLLQKLQALNIDGLNYTIANANTRSGATLTGIYIQLSDWETLRPTELSFHMMKISCQIENKNPYLEATQSRILLYNKHVGSLEWWNALSKNGQHIDVDSFTEQWRKDAADFKKWSSSFWIY